MQGNYGLCADGKNSSSNLSTGISVPRSTLKETGSCDFSYWMYAKSVKNREDSLKAEAKFEKKPETESGPY
jgi:hypothetical protein